MRLIISRAADMGQGRQLMINDIKRAYFYAAATRDLFVELPTEDNMYGRTDLVGKLRPCLYGTRDAAMNWKETVSQHLIDSGFVRGTGFPRVFVHEEKDIWTLVHGDDICSTQKAVSLSWFDTVPSKRYEIKTQRVGIVEGSTREGQILSQVIRATGDGFAMVRGTPNSKLNSCKSW